MLRNERDKYEKFFKTFGNQIKYGIYNNFGKDKEFLQDLVMFYSSKEKKLVTLDEYVSRMPEDQKYIYYATGENEERIARLPQTELVAEKGYEILYFTKDVDEFAIKMLRSYKDKEFKSVTSGDLGIDEENQEEKEAGRKRATKSCLRLYEKCSLRQSEGCTGVQPAENSSGLLLRRRRSLHRNGKNSEYDAEQPEVEIKAEKILEINTSHPVFASSKRRMKATRKSSHCIRICCTTSLFDRRPPR